eukprot:946043-Prymnesium_polylepis.1
MSPEETEQHLLRQWDQRPLISGKDFRNAARDSGGGGGDPSGDPSGDPAAEQAAAAAASANATRGFDIRTRTFEASLMLRTAAGTAERRRLGWKLLAWRELGGALTDDALLLIDCHTFAK